MDETAEQWFVREVLPHEASLMRYLRRVWSHAAGIQDLRQEIYIRMLEAAEKSRPLAPKSFLFATARHLMADRVRRERIVSIETRGDLETLNVAADEISPEQRTGAYQELRQLAWAFDLLPTRCRTVMWMRKVENLSQKEVAAQLGISEKAVGKQVARGIRLLSEALFNGADAGEARGATLDIKSGSGHGSYSRD